jgi:hypothetical protein
MYANEKFDRLCSLFRVREYDLVYLDPMICDPLLRQQVLPQLSLRRPKGERMIALSMNQLAGTLGLRSGDIYSTSAVDNKGFGARIRGNRDLQRRLAQIINQLKAELEKQPQAKGEVQRYYPKVEYLQSGRSSLEKIADRPDSNSIIIADAMVIKEDAAPVEIRSLVETPARYLGNCIRNIEFVLADKPGPMIKLYHPVIGLMVDWQAASDWTEALDAILKAGWYPYARVVGRYATLPGKLPYVDVIAIMLCPLPSLDEMIGPPSGKVPAYCLRGVLEQLLPELDQEIKSLQEEKSKATKADTGTGAIAYIPRVYERDAEFLYPGYLFKLCCELNGVNWQGLQDRASHICHILNAYTQRLIELGKHLTDLGIQSLIVDLKIDSRKFLPHH